MNIFLVRHTKVDIDKSICYGQSDVGVAETFNKEADTVKTKLPLDIEKYNLFSSPLKRCRLLAEEIGNPDFLEDFKEINFGDWELIPWNTFPKEQIDNWQQNLYDFKPPNGESFKELINRVNASFEKLVKQNADSILVSHSMPIRIIISDILGIPYDKTFRLKLDYGSVIKLKIEGEFKQVEFL